MMARARAGGGSGVAYANKLVVATCAHAYAALRPEQPEQRA